MVKKSVYDVVSEAHNVLLELHPTPDEIDGFAKFKEDKNEGYGVVTYSRSKGGSLYFIRFHDKYQKEIGGRTHIDVGYVDLEYKKKRLIDTIHLMLDKDTAPEFIEFIKESRGE